MKFHNIKDPTFALLALAVLSLSIATAQAAGGAAIVAQGVGQDGTACGACHGAAGAGNDAAGIPQLAGLNAAYLQRQLVAFASGDRQNPVMTPVAKALSADQSQAVSVYYAKLPRPAVAPDNAQSHPGSGTDSDAMGMGIAQRGRWGRSVAESLPACVLCHGPDGIGVGENFPALAGQSSRYIAAQLRAWQQGIRPPGPQGLMPAIAKRLSAEEIDAVSKYFSELSPATEDGQP